MKWEYAATWVDYGAVNQELTAYGEQGWELVVAHLNDREARWYTVYKRPKIDDAVAPLPVAAHCPGCGREIIEDKTPSPRGAPMTLMRNADDNELHSCSP